MTLMAAWAVLLGRISGQQDVVIGTVTANRDRQDVQGLIGFFVNTSVSSSTPWPCACAWRPTRPWTRCCNRSRN